MLSPWDIIRRYLLIFLALLGLIVIVGLWLYRAAIWSFMMSSLSSLFSGVLVIAILVYVIFHLLLGF